VPAERRRAPKEVETGVNILDLDAGGGAEKFAKEF
jgi:hypothetical protein